MAQQASRAPRPSARDRSFLQQVVQEETSEMDLARLALQKSSDPQVRSYAQSILSNDATVEKNAQKLAPVVIQSASAEGAAEHRKLAQMSSREFEQEYMKYEAARQQQDLQTLVKEIDTTHDARLLDFGIKAEVPTQEAEKRATSIASELGGSVSARNSPKQ